MQRLREVFLPDQARRRQNEDEAFNSHSIDRTVGFSTAAFVGYGEVLLRTVALSAGVFTGAAFGASLIGLPLTFHFWLYFSRGLRELMSQQSSWIRMPVMFLFHASMAILSGFIGLAIVAACTSAIGVNPFVLPCLIAVAVAGAIVVASAIAVVSRTQYIAPKEEPTLSKLPRLMLQATLGNNNRPFHVNDEHFIYENKIIVKPFGQEKSEEPVASSGYEARSFAKYFGSLFNNNKASADNGDESAEANDSSTRYSSLYTTDAGY